MSLTLDSVNLTYPDGDSRLTALGDVTLHVSAGEFIAVTGPSGSGKSSLLAVAGTLIAPDSGRVEIAGVDAGPLDSAARDRLRLQSIGFVFQQSNLLASLTAMDQLLLVDEPTSALDRERGEAVVALLAEITREQNLATVMVTHDLANVHLTDRVVHVHDGRLVVAESAAPEPSPARLTLGHGRPRAVG